MGHVDESLQKLSNQSAWHKKKQTIQPQYIGNRIETEVTSL